MQHEPHTPPCCNLCMALWCGSAIRGRAGKKHTHGAGPEMRKGVDFSRRLSWGARKRLMLTWVKLGAFRDAEIQKWPYVHRVYRCGGKNAGGGGGVPASNSTEARLEASAPGWSQTQLRAPPKPVLPARPRPPTRSLFRPTRANSRFPTPQRGWRSSVADGRPWDCWLRQHSGANPGSEM